MHKNAMLIPLTLGDGESPEEVLAELWDDTHLMAVYADDWGWPEERHKHDTVPERTHHVFRPLREVVEEYYDAERDGPACIVVHPPK